MMQDWFLDAKLGIFIHYGIYSFGDYSESWAFKAKQVSYRKYMRQKDTFKAEKFNAEDWAELFRDAGAKYSVLTAKHHDGVALYDTAHSELSTVKLPSCGKDILKEYCDAVRKAGLKVGIYFSQLDWSHPDYASKQWKPLKAHSKKRWENYLKFHRAQLKEIMGYNPDLLWFDGDWERPEEEWDMKGLRDYLHSFNPDVVINSRIGTYGDYETPEQQLPTKIPKKPFEYCMTINDSWGYRKKDSNNKSPFEIIRIFSEIISMGGNFLLDAGPKEDGTITEEQRNVLLKLGSFVRANADGIYGTRGLKNDFFRGGVTVSKDKKTLYLIQYGTPWSDMIAYGIDYAEKVRRLDDNRSIKFKIADGNLVIDKNEVGAIDDAAIFEVKLSKPYERNENVYRQAKEFKYTGLKDIGKLYYSGDGAVSEDGKKVFLSVDSAVNAIMLKGLKNKIISVTDEDGEALKYRFFGRMHKTPGTLFIDVSNVSKRKPFTVIITTKGNAEFYAGTGAPISKPVETID